MAQFDPSKHNKPPENGIPAGDYLLVLKGFRRNVGKTSGKPYLRAVISVIHGPAKGKSFFDSISLDMANSGAMFRLSMLAEQCGSGPFDLDSDEEIKAALVGKPFKARVSREVNGQYINNGIQRYLGRETTDFERRVMETWVVDEAERQQFGGDGGGGFDSSGLPYDDTPPSVDDDIPF